MCWKRAMTIAAARDAPRTARAFVTDELDGLIGDRVEITDDAELIISELVANAVNAGADAVMVSLELHHSHLRLSVEDNANGIPALRHAELTDDHGRGLEIVAGLSTGWGMSERPPGKEVWADLAVPEPFSDDDFVCSMPLTR